METEQSEEEQERSQKRRPMVLVVDDDESHQKLLALLADRLEITAFIASSCREAVEALEMFSFDLVLMDYRMPEVDGYACTKKIRALREHSKRIPIIAVTAHVTLESKLQAIDAGLDDFLPKPFTLEQLKEKIDQWLIRVEPD
jgi:CheY-like chemotaxis protein